MYKTLILLSFIFLIWSCDSKKGGTQKIDIATLQLHQYTPQIVFDKCLELETYQLLAAANHHLEEFITNELLSEGEDLAVGYQRFVQEWTGQTYSEMNTKKLLDDNFANALYTHSNFKNIWIPLIELGDTTYTEQLAYDKDGNEVIVKYIENYYTLNTNSNYYKCLKNIKNGFIQNYLINKEYGDIEPQDFATELIEMLDFEQYNDPIIQNIITTELYLRLIAIRNKSIGG